MKKYIVPAALLLFAVGGVSAIASGQTVYLKRDAKSEAVEINGTVTIEGGTFNVVNYIAWDETNYGGAAAIYNSGTGSVIVKDGTFTSNTTARWRKNSTINNRRNTKKTSKRKSRICISKE